LDCCHASERIRSNPYFLNLYSVSTRGHLMLNVHTMCSTTAHGVNKLKDIFYEKLCMNPFPIRVADRDDFCSAPDPEYVLNKFVENFLLDDFLAVICSTKFFLMNLIFEQHGFIHFL
jgi:hypothetical protein